MSSNSPTSSDAPSQRRGVVAVIPRQQRLLVIRRSALVRAPLAHCFPGGGMELGETEPEALRRELWEELALPIEPVRRLWRCTTPWGVQLSWWLAQASDIRLTPNPEEVEAFFWLPPQEIRSLPGLLVSNHEFLDAWALGTLSWEGAELGEIRQE